MGGAIYIKAKKARFPLFNANTPGPAAPAQVMKIVSFFHHYLRCLLPFCPRFIRIKGNGSAQLPGRCQGAQQ